MEIATTYSQKMVISLNFVTLFVSPFVGLKIEIYTYGEIVEISNQKLFTKIQ